MELKLNFILLLSLGKISSQISRSNFQDVLYALLYDIPPVFFQMQLL